MEISNIFQGWKQIRSQILLSLHLSIPDQVTKAGQEQSGQRPKHLPGPNKHNNTPRGVQRALVLSSSSEMPLLETVLKVTHDLKTYKVKHPSVLSTPTPNSQSLGVQTKAFPKLLVWETSSCFTFNTLHPHQPHPHQPHLHCPGEVSLTPREGWCGEEKRKAFSKI